MTPFSVAFQREVDSSPFVLTAGDHFHFDIDRFENFFKQPLPGRILDLLRIASAIYFVDRLARRPCSWSRRLQLNVGVVDPEFWSSAVVKEPLTETLEFLSDDSWVLSFTKDDQRPHKTQQTLFDISGDVRLCLYSGGLDSAAGLINRVTKMPNSPVIPVTVWHQKIQRKLVREQLKAISHKSDVAITGLIVKAAIRWPHLKDRFREEPTQRSRSFLFTAAGAAAAAMTGGKKVEIYESGIGAINLPLMSGMVGSRTTRSAHPTFLRRMSRLVELVIGRPMTFDLPFMQQTKAQVLSSVKGSGLEEMIETTVSCVRYPLREAGAKQCGTCPACIFRRQSLTVAELHEPAGTYKYDLFDDVVAANSVPTEKLDYIKAFLGQLMQLECIRENQPLPRAVRCHLFGTGILNLNDSSDSVAKLFSTYRDEWKGLIAQLQGRGFSWTKLYERRLSRTEGAHHVVA